MIRKEQLIHTNIVKKIYYEKFNQVADAAATDDETEFSEPFYLRLGLNVSNVR